MVAWLLLSYRCIVTINVLLLFLTVPWIGLKCVIVVFPDHINLLFSMTRKYHARITQTYSRHNEEEI